MSKVILIRHAQASLHKENYDALSELGFRQAEFLGKYLEQNFQAPCSIISGTLTRHVQTADKIRAAYSHELDYTQDTDWNEFNFKKLIQLYLDIHPQVMPSSKDMRAFFSILKKSMLAWSQDELDCKAHGLESWHEFSVRVHRALERITTPEDGEFKFVISSGGAIAMKLMQILEAPANTMINLNFQTKNSSFSELKIKRNQINLVAFNQVNHLLNTKGKNLVTYV